MLDSLTRIFHATSASEGPPTASTSAAGLLDAEPDSKHRAASIDLGTLASALHADAASNASVRTLDSRLQSRPSTLSLATTPDRLRGPSHVSWRLPTPSATPTASRPSLLHFNGSSPMLVGDPGHSSGGNGKRTSARLGTPSPLGFDKDRESVVFPSGSASKPLSPIGEAMQPRTPVLNTDLGSGYGYSYAPRRVRESFDSDRSLDVPPTPGSIRSSAPHTPSSLRAFDPHMIQLPGGAFITRPLNRSISQASTSSLRSTASAAPTIPPLDLRPAFSPAAPSTSSPGVSTPVMRKPRFTPGMLPAVLGSPSNPRPKYSIIYEDGGSARTTASFVTAPTDGSDDGESDGEQDRTPKAQEGLPPTSPKIQSPHGPPYFVVQPPSPEEVAAHPTRTRTPSLLAPPDTTPDARTSRLPEGLHEVDLSSPIRYGPYAGLRAEPTPTATASRPSLTSSRSAEDAIFQRWLKGISFQRPEFVSVTTSSANATAPRVLFWLGFLGPWCWLIGGWAAELEGKPRRNPLLPRWVGDAEKEAAKGKGKAAPLLVPSRESLARSETLVNMTAVRGHRVAMDPWVWRCRVAAVVSGLLVLAAFIVAIVVVTV